MDKGTLEKIVSAAMKMAVAQTKTPAPGVLPGKYECNPDVVSRIAAVLVNHAITNEEVRRALIG